MAGEVGLGPCPRTNPFVCAVGLHGSFCSCLGRVCAVLCLVLLLAMATQHSGSLAANFKSSILSLRSVPDLAAPERASVPGPGGRRGRSSLALEAVVGVSSLALVAVAGARPWPWWPPWATMRAALGGRQCHAEPEPPRVRSPSPIDSDRNPLMLEAGTWV